ncbi:hypothetical protein OSTOST_10783 [Ostertagia ostertagi]
MNEFGTTTEIMQAKVAATIFKDVNQDRLLKRSLSCGLHAFQSSKKSKKVVALRWLNARMCTHVHVHMDGLRGEIKYGCYCEYDEGKIWDLMFIRCYFKESDV